VCEKNSRKHHSIYNKYERDWIEDYSKEIRKLYIYYTVYYTVYYTIYLLLYSISLEMIREVRPN